MLPVTGECPADMWNEVNESVAKDLDVADFMQTAMAGKFYQYWKDGVVTDRLIGHRFGYGVLGRYYSKRLWEQGCFDGMEEESGQAPVPLIGHPVEDESLQETQVDCEATSQNVGGEEEREQAAADEVDREAGPVHPEDRCLEVEDEPGEGTPEVARRVRDTVRDNRRPVQRAPRRVRLLRGQEY